MSIDEKALVSAADLSKLLGVSGATLSRLAQTGVATKAASGKYRLAASITSYCAHLRGSASGRASPAAEGRGRLLTAQADLAEAKAKLASGELVEVKDVATRWA